MFLFCTHCYSSYQAVYIPSSHASNLQLLISKRFISFHFCLIFRNFQLSLAHFAAIKLHYYENLIHSQHARHFPHALTDWVFSIEEISMLSACCPPLLLLILNLGSRSSAVCMCLAAPQAHKQALPYPSDDSCVASKSQSLNSDWSHTTEQRTWGIL